MSFYYFESFLGVFDQYIYIFFEVIYILQTFGIVCFLFFVQINFFKFQISDSNFSFSYLLKKKSSHFLKKIIMIIKSHHKFRIDITQIIKNHIQIHRHVDVF